MCAQSIKTKLKENLNWNYPPFTVPEEIKPRINKTINKGKRIEKKWKELLRSYEIAYPELATEYKKWFSGKVVKIDCTDILATFKGSEATRSSGSNALNFLADFVPNLFGGSADLGPSNKSVMKNRTYFS